MIRSHTLTLCFFSCTGARVYTRILRGLGCTCMDMTDSIPVTKDNFPEALKELAGDPASEPGTLVKVLRVCSWAFPLQSSESTNHVDVREE